jgi:hypothetical protein
MYRFRHLIILPALLSAGLMSLHAVAAEPPILTISGAIEQVNRGPSHEDDATMLGAHDISFQKGFSVTREDLARLDQITYIGSIPGQIEPVTFRGPALTDVVELAGGQGDTITVTALDGYGVEMERTYVETHKAILAIEADGASLAIGDLGPSVTVFPRTDDAALAEEFAARQIWAAFHIGVK